MVLIMNEFWETKSDVIQGQLHSSGLSFSVNFCTTGLLPLKFPCYLFICVSELNMSSPLGLCPAINTFARKTLDNGELCEIRSL